MKHSITTAVLCLALSSATASVGSAQESAGVGVGSGSALLSRDLRGEADFQANPVLKTHVQAALKYAKKKKVEVGFGFYTNSNLDKKYVPGKVRSNGSRFYTHLNAWEEEDTKLLGDRFGGPGDDWKLVGDAHVHEGKEEIKEENGKKTRVGVQQHKGAPSLNDIKGELKPKVAPTHIMMTIASRKWVKGFDASIVFRNGALAAHSRNYKQVIDNAEAKNRPQSHQQAMNILGDAYSGDNITYFSGSFKGKRSKLKSGLFKYKGKP